jgi:hypothetical protein
MKGFVDFVMSVHQRLYSISLSLLGQWTSGCRGTYYIPLILPYQLLILMFFSFGLIFLAALGFKLGLTLG